MRCTGLIGQYQALDMDQQQGFRRANGQTTEYGDEKGGSGGVGCITPSTADICELLLGLGRF